MSGKRGAIALLLVLTAVPCVWSNEAAKVGNRAFQEDRFAEAIEAYEEALRASPTFAIHINLGHCHMRTGQWSEAVKDYEAALALGEASAAREVWRFLGQARYRSGQIEKALEAFQRADGTGLDPAGQESLWIARCLVELGRSTPAEAAVYESLRRDPGSTEALELLAQVQGQMNNWAGVVETYTQLLTREPERTRYRIALANAQVAAGRNRQALDTLEFTWRLDRSPAGNVGRLLADLYLAEAMPLEAAACYARVIRETNSPTTEDYLRLGMAYYRGNELNSAMRAFERTEHLDPNDARTRLFRGHAAVKRDRMEEAQDCYKAALALDPNATEAVLAMAQLHLEQGQYAQAADRFAQVLKKGDRSAAVHYNCLLAMMHIGISESHMRGAFQGALAEHPTDDRIVGLLDRFVSQVAAVPTAPTQR